MFPKRPPPLWFCAEVASWPLLAKLFSKISLYNPCIGHPNRKNPVIKSSNRKVWGGPPHPRGGVLKTSRGILFLPFSAPAAGYSLFFSPFRALARWRGYAGITSVFRDHVPYDLNHSWSLQALWFEIIACDQTTGASTSRPLFYLILIWFFMLGIIFTSIWKATRANLQTIYEWYLTHIPFVKLKITRNICSRFTESKRKLRRIILFVKRTYDLHF